ncbi:MAG: class I tRNA ligase family protein, partial [Phycisphaerales bacterium]|nr:class I tRNA ligase family protein [Phycisphaerales bacterium]
IAAIMELMNDLYAAEPRISRPAMNQVVEILTLMLAPFTPYLAEELWEELGRTGPVMKQPWPAWDPDLAKEDTIEMPVQVNGKVRGRIVVQIGASKEAIEQHALQDDKIQQFVNGKTIVKIIIVPEKLVNIVVKG